jgi:hypothetical protein
MNVVLEQIFGLRNMKGVIKVEELVFTISENIFL